MESCKLCKLQLNFCWNISGTNSQNPKCNHVQLRCQLRCSFHQLHRFFYLSAMRNPGSVCRSAMAVAGGFESTTQKTQASGQKHSWPVQLSHHPLVEIERYKEGISATLMIWVLQIIGRGLFFATDVGITASSSKTRANLRFWVLKTADQKILRWSLVLYSFPWRAALMRPRMWPEPHSCYPFNHCEHPQPP